MLCGMGTGVRILPHSKLCSLPTLKKTKKLFIVASYYGLPPRCLPTKMHGKEKNLANNVDNLVLLLNTQNATKKGIACTGKRDHSIKRWCFLRRVRII